MTNTHLHRWGAACAVWLLASLVATPAAGAQQATLTVPPGTVWVWTREAPRPVATTGLSDVIQIADAFLHLKADGTVWLRDYIVRFNRLEISAPQQVAGLHDITQIASASRSTGVALQKDGTVWAWGRNDHGQLGSLDTPVAVGCNGSACPPVPVQVPNLSGVRQLAPGGQHTLALVADGSVWSWGGDVHGELGRDAMDQCSFDPGFPPDPCDPTPQQVPGLDKVVQISAGSGSLVLRSDGTVWSWGSNQYGELGDPDADEAGRTDPTPIAGLADVTQIAAGAFESLAVKRDGSVWQWGVDTQGQDRCGMDSCARAPRQVAGLSGITSVRSGGRTQNSLALAQDGSVWAFGVGHDQPERVDGLPKVAQISASFLANIALVASVSGGQAPAATAPQPVAPAKPAAPGSIDWASVLRAQTNPRVKVSPCQFPNPRVPSRTMCIGGSYAALDLISVGDIVGDGSTEAVIPLDSGGSIGQSGSLIFLLDPSRGPQLVSAEGPGGAVFIDGGQLVALGPDPNTNCSTLVCFDGMLRTTYKLVGATLQRTGACTYLPDPSDLRKAQGACTPYSG